MQKYKDKKVAILGLGLEGKDVLVFLQAQGASVAVFDEKPFKNLDIKGVNVSGVRFFCGNAYDLSKIGSYDIIVRSPGVYRYLPEIIAAEKSGCQITSPINIFLELCPAKTVGVTGTKGKGTTSTLIYEILKTTGFRVHLAGNIGKPFLTLLPGLSKKDWVVLELSSFQLIDIKKSPNIAVVLNITVDHLDWHKDRKEYVNAKKSIVVHQKSGDAAVINGNYPEVKKFGKLGSGKKFYFGNSQKLSGAFVTRGQIFVGKSFIGETKDLLLKGKHNWENVLAASLAARLAGASLVAITKTVFSFKGLEHRLELVGNFKGKGYYNDSFSTNPQTTIAAVWAFKEPITIILGGFDKHLNYNVMGRQIARSTVQNCVLIGDIAGKIKKALIAAKFRGAIIEMGYVDMVAIVRKCHQITPTGGVVVLSPGSSSFDMFENYKERGYAFKKAVKNLSKLTT